MPDLVAGTRILAADYPVAVEGFDDTDYHDLSNTTYAAGLAEVTFVAPTSGRVLVIVGGGARDDGTDTNRVFVTPEVWEGTSAGGNQVLQPVAPQRGIIIHGTADRTAVWSRITVLEGLTPEQVYFARALRRVDGGTTADLFVHRISIIPVP